MKAARGEVFKVDDMGPVGADGRFVVRGRAYADVRVGELLSTSPGAEPSLRVEEIETYRVRTELLARMMTGSLVVSGGTEAALRAAVMLYREPPGGDAQTERSSYVAKALVGQTCWHVSAGGCTAPSFLLALGEKRARSRPLTNPIQDPDFRHYRGSVELLVWCSWRLEDGPRVLSSSDQGSRGMASLGRLRGQGVVAAACSPPAWDMTLQFSNQLVLQIFCDNVGPDPLIAQNWEIWTPEGYTRAGPGEELEFVRE